MIFFVLFSFFQVDKSDRFAPTGKKKSSAFALEKKEKKGKIKEQD
jgi:hypothetical protein